MNIEEDLRLKHIEQIVTYNLITSIFMSCAIIIILILD